MAEPRTYIVCSECGTWKEMGGTIDSFFADYDMPFWIEHHGVRCPITGKPARHEQICEDDADYKPLPAEKKWRPESVPGYHPPQKPKYARCLTNLEAQLAGSWTERDFGGSNPDEIIFSPDGSGVIGTAGSTPDEGTTFHWRLEGQEHLCFGNPKLQEKDGAVKYFERDSIYFELLTYTNCYGDVRSVLCFYPDGLVEKPMEFVKGLR